MTGSPTPLDDGHASAPAGAVAAWALKGRPPQGRRRGLDVASIVEAGVEVVARDGVHGLTMGRVAAQLGAGTMSLYRHVSSRDELLALMVDHALGAPGTRAVDDGWRAGLAAWAGGLRDVYRRHPWVLDVPISGPPTLPHDVEHLESALQALAATGLGEHDKLSTVLLVSGFVRNDALLARSVTPSTAGEVMASYSATLAALVDLARFPAVRRAVDSGALDRDDLDDEFRFGLDRILDGVEVLLGTGRTSGSGAGTVRPT
jgi:AcrR family transcriptional regulator